MIDRRVCFVCFFVCFVYFLFSVDFCLARRHACSDECGASVRRRSSCLVHSAGTSLEKGGWPVLVAFVQWTCMVAMILPPLILGASQAAPTLQKMNIDTSMISVSGLSSGGFMAGKFFLLLCMQD